MSIVFSSSCSVHWVRLSWGLCILPTIADCESSAISKSLLLFSSSLFDICFQAFFLNYYFDEFLTFHHDVSYISKRTLSIWINFLQTLLLSAVGTVSMHIVMVPNAVLWTPLCCSILHTLSVIIDFHQMFSMRAFYTCLASMLSLHGFPLLW